MRDLFIIEAKKVYKFNDELINCCRILHLMDCKENRSFLWFPLNCLHILQRDIISLDKYDYVKNENIFRKDLKFCFFIHNEDNLHWFVK